VRSELEIGQLDMLMPQCARRFDTIARLTAINASSGTRERSLLRRATKDYGRGSTSIDSEHRIGSRFVTRLDEIEDIPKRAMKH
jgi:hypothetical protein